MKKVYLEVKNEGFHGVYYKNSENCDKAFIGMFGDDCDDTLAHVGAKYLFKR